MLPIPNKINSVASFIPNNLKKEGNRLLGKNVIDSDYSPEDPSDDHLHDEAADDSCIKVVDTEEVSKSELEQSTLSTPNVVSKKILLGLLEKIQFAIQAQRAKLGLAGTANNVALDLQNAQHLTLHSLIELLNKTPGENISLKQWAKLSLGLEKLARDLNEIQNKMKGDGLAPFDFIIKCTNQLKRISDTAWAQLAIHKLVIRLMPFYKKDQGYSASQTTTSTLGVSSLLLQVSGEASVSYTEAQAMDDEGYYGESQSVGLQATASANLGASPLLSLAKANFTGKYSQGNFEEWSNDYNYVRTHLDEAMLKHGHKLEIAHLLSRAGTLGDEKSISEIISFDRSLSDFKEDETQILNLMSVLNSITYKAPVGTGNRATEAIKLVPLKKIARSFKGDYSAGMIEAGVEVGLPGAPLTAKVTHQHTVIDATRRTPLCKKFQEQDSTCTQQIKEEILLKSTDLREAVSTLWLQKAIIGVPTLVSNHSPENAAAAETANIVNTNLAETDIAFLNSATKLTVEQASHYFAFLKRDFEHYTLLQAQLKQERKHQNLNFFQRYILQEKISTELAIAEFHNLYKATSKETLLHRMVILNALFFSDVMNEPGADQLKANILELEAALLNPTFSCKLEHLEKNGYFQEGVKYQTIDKKVSITVNPSLFPDSLSISSESQTNEAKIVFRDREHTNPFRKGKYIDVSFSIGLDNKVNSDAISKISSYLQTSGMQEVGKYFSGGSFSTAGTYTVRFYKPSMFNRPYRKLYTRLALSRESKVGMSVPIPVAPGVILTAGVNYATTTSQCISETYASGSLLNFSLRFMHACAEEEISPTGEVKPDSYWNTVKSEQHDTLMKIFQSLPITENGDVIAYTKPEGDGWEIVKELKEIETEFFKDEKQRSKFNQMKTEFFIAAKNYQDQVSDENYQTSIICFEKMLYTFYQPWKKAKMNSDLYRPKSFTVDFDE